MRPVSVFANGPGSEIEQLEAALRGRWREAARAVMAVLSAHGLPPAQIAELLGCHPATVRRWIGRFNCEGTAGLADRPRSGRPAPGGRRVTGRIAALLARPGPWTLPRIRRYLGWPQVSARTLYRRVRLVAVWRRPKLTARGDPDHGHVVAGIVARLLELPRQAVVLVPSPKLVPLELTDDERQALEAWARRRKTAQALALRSRIILACSDGSPNQAVAAELGVSRDTVSKWRSRFLAGRLEGLTDEPRPGRPRTVSDEKVEQVITATLEQAPPGGDTHWSTRSMARSSGVSQSTVSRIWRTFGLKPHVVQTWKLSTGPQFIDKVRDVVGLYMSPPENALVLCVDEKSQIQALDRTAPILPMLPTTPARRTHDYVRNGTTSLFAAFDLASGSVIAQHYRKHRHREFLRFLKLIDDAVPQDLDLDNYATHKTPVIHKWLLRHPRFHLHFTPTSSSWLNLVERWFAELTNRKLRRSAHRSVTELETDIRKWITEWNKNPKPFVWTKTADQILETLAAYCGLITDSGH